MAGTQTLIIPYFTHPSIPTPAFLLGEKVRGPFQGLQVFPGGKPESRAPHEPIEKVHETAARELCEETGIIASKFDFLGRLLVRLTTSFEDSTETVAQVDVLSTKVDIATARSIAAPTGSDLANLRWYTIDTLSGVRLPSDYMAWLPLANTILELGEDPTDKINFNVYIDRSITQSVLTSDVSVNGIPFSLHKQLPLPADDGFVK